jgi:hypothetical protein
MKITFSGEQSFSSPLWFVLSQIQRRKKYRFHEENGVSFLGGIPNVRFLQETPSNDSICAKCYRGNFLSGLDINRYQSNLFYL